MFNFEEERSSGIVMTTELQNSSTSDDDPTAGVGLHDNSSHCSNGLKATSIPRVQRLLAGLEAQG